MEEKSNRNIVIILLCVCVLSLLMGIFANYRLIVINKENQKQKEQVKSNKKEKVIEKKDNQEDNNKKRADLIISVLNYQNSPAGSIYPNYYEKQMSIDGFSDGEKMTFIIFNLFKDGRFEDQSYYVDSDEASVRYPNAYNNGCVPEDIYTVLKYDEFEKSYENVFGAKPDVKQFDNEIFKYVEEYNLFFSRGMCGTSSSGFESYTYKYDEDSEYYYAYVTVLYTYLDGVYKDSENKEFVKKYSDYKELEEMVKNNNGELYNYRFVFDKKGDTFYFNRVERVN